MLEYGGLRSSDCADPPAVNTAVSRKIRQVRARTVLLFIGASTIPSIWTGCGTIAENAICMHTHWARACAEGRALSSAPARSLWCVRCATAVHGELVHNGSNSHQL